MSCCNICGNDPCNCSTPICPPVDCADPGIIPVGAFLPILDYKFCERRLENQTGFLVANQAEGGPFQIFFTDEPCIPVPQIELGLGTEISSVLGMLGTGSCMRRLVPGAEIDGWLRALNGVWQISALPSDNIPDPFVTENLEVTDTATINKLVVQNSLCFDALAADTITDFVGLNGAGCLVKGNVSQIEAALYYESASLTSVGTPNTPIGRNVNAIIGNEIFDPQGVAHVLNTTTIEIDKAGTYLIFWTGFYDRDDASVGDSGLHLWVDTGAGAVLRAYSSGRAEHVNPPNSANPLGFHLMALTAGNKINLQTSSGSNLTNNHLQDVKLLLVRYRTS